MAILRLLRESKTLPSHGTRSWGARRNVASIPIMLALIRPVHRHTDVIGLVLRQLRQLRADLGQMQPGDFSSKCFGST